MNELKRFESDLKASEDLRKKLDEAAARIRDEGRARSDGELLVAAAKELGYDFSITALEKSRAEAEPLDAVDFEEVAGGRFSTTNRKEACHLIWDQYFVDEYNHNAWCIATWHCHTVMLHTDSEDYQISCWENYVQQDGSRP